MDRKQMCVANLRYKRPSAGDSGSAKGLLGYLTYRESRDEAARFVAGQERWVDHGMGHSVAQILRRCEDLRSDHVLMFNLVVNPNPDLVAMIPPAQRERFVRQLTERVVDGFFEARGLDTGCEYAYVVHHRQTDDPQSPGQHNPHTHVVLPGTVYDEEHGGRVPLYFSRNQKVNHIEMLHNVTEQTMAQQMERYVGRDWEQRYNALATVREQQQAIVGQTPHGYEQDTDDPEIAWGVWCGTRRTDERTSAVGCYRRYVDPTEDEPRRIRVEFRPLVAGLPHEQAEFFARRFARDMDGDVERLNGLAAWVNGMSDGDRRALIEEAERTAPSREIAFYLER